MNNQLNKQPLKFLEQIEDAALRAKVAEKVQTYLNEHPDFAIEAFQDIGYMPLVGTFIMMVVNTLLKKDVCALLYYQDQLMPLSSGEVRRMYFWLVEREKHGKI